MLSANANPSIVSAVTSRKPLVPILMKGLVHPHTIPVRTSNAGTMNMNFNFFYLILHKARHQSEEMKI